MTPARRYRILRDPDISGPVAIYYKTAEARNHAARRYAKRDGRTVLTEEWFEDLPQDDLNRGWATVDAVHPY